MNSVISQTSTKPYEAALAILVATMHCDDQNADAETNFLHHISDHHPLFKSLPDGVYNECVDRVRAVFNAGGWRKLLEVYQNQLPIEWRKTALYLAIDMAAADGKFDKAEIAVIGHFSKVFEIDQGELMTAIQVLKTKNGIGLA